MAPNYEHDGKYAMVNQKALRNPELSNKYPSFGRPEFPNSFTWKDALATGSCFSSLAIATIIVFEPRMAVYWGQTRQFIWIGLCLTLMGWCAQYPLRRIFLISSTKSRASTLQSLDAILRSDPLTSRADWRVRVVLFCMLALGPALSAAYKSLGGGDSRYKEDNMTGQFGLIDPPGTHDIGYGLSQFVNATLPWFKDPGYPNRVYGFNMHVATENTSAMLDGPVSDYVNSLQASLQPTQSKIITATVPAIVAELNPHLSHSVQYFQNLSQEAAANTSSPSYVETWTEVNTLHIAMLMPIESDNTNLVIANWNDTSHETFGSHLRQYSLSRQNYTGSWRITPSSISLISATPTNQRIDDHCLLSNDWLALADLYTRMFAEYDWRYRSTDLAFYQANIKSDATLLASMVWSRIAAVGPETKTIGLTPQPSCTRDYLQDFQYDTDVTIETAAVTVKPGWGIIFVLAIYPTILIVSFVFRMIAWPLSPIGEGFGLVSLLASLNKSSLALLGGATLSGKLVCPVFVSFAVAGREDFQGLGSGRAGEITTFLGTKRGRSEGLEKGTKYH